jgi:large subunit ribosomal protein L54
MHKTDAVTAKATLKSSCPQGTVLTGLNISKTGTDPVAMADDAYPTWLWDFAEPTPIDELPIDKRLRKLRGAHIKQVNTKQRKR